MHITTDELKDVIEAIQFRMASFDLRDKAQYEKYDALSDVKAKFDYELVKRTQVHR